MAFVSLQISQQENFMKYWINGTILNYLNKIQIKSGMKNSRLE